VPAMAVAACGVRVGVTGSARAGGAVGISRAGRAVEVGGGVGEAAGAVWHAAHNQSIIVIVLNP
jgi:hypothetical protein